MRKWKGFSSLAIISILSIERIWLFSLQWDNERHFKVRAYDHFGLSILTEKPIKGVDTAMKSHWRENNHIISMDNIEIIAREENPFHLRIKESLLIKRDKPSLNNNVYATPLLLFWRYAMKVAIRDTLIIYIYTHIVIKNFYVLILYSCHKLIWIYSVE